MLFVLSLVFLVGAIALDYLSSRARTAIDQSPAAPPTKWEPM